MSGTPNRSIFLSMIARSTHRRNEYARRGRRCGSPQPLPHRGGGEPPPPTPPPTGGEPPRKRCRSDACCARSDNPSPTEGEGSHVPSSRVQARGKGRRGGAVRPAHRTEEGKTGIGTPKKPSRPRPTPRRRTDPPDACQPGIAYAIMRPVCYAFAYWTNQRYF